MMGGSLAMVLLAVWAAATRATSSVLPEQEHTEVAVSSAVMTQLVEIAHALCSKTPALEDCGYLNHTLLQGEDGERADVPLEHRVSTLSPLLSLALSHFSSTQQRERDLVERDARHMAQVASLQVEKAELEERLSLLQEGQRGYVRPTRDAQITLLTPLEAVSTSHRGPQHLPPPNQHITSATSLRPVDCADYLVMGYTVSGLYDIYPFRCRCSKPVQVWCDMETDGGGWTVFLTRKSNSTRANFNRTWSDYREGFGNASQEHWLGNEVLYTITNARAYTLRMDFQLVDGNLKWGEWPVFKVNSEAALYKLEVPQYTSQSMIDHCFSLNNNRYFSTYDYDNDGSTAKNCALETGGGWWYNNCGTLEATRPFAALGSLNTTCPYKIHTKKIPLKGTWMQMKIRPRVCSEAVKAVLLNSYSCLDHNVV